MDLIRDKRKTVEKGSKRCLQREMYPLMSSNRIPSHDQINEWNVLIETSLVTWAIRNPLLGGLLLLCRL